MELIHIANATFSSNKKSRLKWASKQKTFRIVKEQHDARGIARSHEPTPAARPAWVGVIAR